MGKNFSKAKSWEKTTVLKAPAKEVEVEENNDSGTVSINNAPYVVSNTSGPNEIRMYTWASDGTVSNTFTEIRSQLERELEEMKEKLRQANWKIKILEGILTDIGYYEEGQ